MRVIVPVLAWYVVASVVAMIAYALDKRAAQRGERRTPERTLHLIELAGGWPGALVAGRMLRHKTRDGRFRVVRAAVIVAHVAAWAGGLVILAAHV